MSRVLLADTTPIVRAALRDMLLDMGHEVLGEAADVPAALGLARDLQPDLVILELALPGAGGLDLLRRLRARDAKQKLLVYSRQSPAHFAPLCFQAGANGFVGKREDLDNLRTAVIDVLAGRGHFAREHMQQGSGNELERLTPRELAVLQLLAEGYSNLRIAEQLLISFKTVSTYKARLLEKLHVSSNVELAEVARRNGLVTAREAAANEPPSGTLQGDMGLLRPLLDASPNPMFVRSLDGNLLFCNQRFLDYYRIDAAEAIGSGFNDAHWFPRELRQRLPATFRRVASEGKPVAGTYQVDIFGEPHLLHFWMVPYRDSTGQCVVMLGGLQDVTETEGQVVELRDRVLAAEARERQQRVTWAAALDELSAMAARLPDSGESGVLPRLREGLQRLRRSSELQERRVAPPPEACDLLALISRCLIGRSAGVFVTQRVDAARVWIDSRTFGEWLLAAVALFQADAIAPLLIDVSTQVAGLGHLIVNLELRGAAAPDSVIDLDHCRHLAKQLDGQMRQGHGEDLREVGLVLELPIAGPA
ncbi:response regulator [Pseudomonas knackmussii]|uniref:response regulator n=1 Tax=Pseudomonas knackmussii TaxID=65741 RepID=UPI003F4A2EC0